MKVTNISAEEKKDLIDLFFNGTVYYQPGNVSRRFINKEGFKDGPVAILFRQDFEPDDEEYSLIKNNTVLFFAEPPASTSEIRFLMSFNELLSNLELVFTKKMQTDNNNVEMYKKRLIQLRNALMQF